MVASIRPVNLLSPVGTADVPTILDLEASGFGRDSYPIEVGYVLPDGSSFCSLIRPRGTGRTGIRPPSRCTTSAATPW